MAKSTRIVKPVLLLLSILSLLLRSAECAVRGVVKEPDEIEIGGLGHGHGHRRLPMDKISVTDNAYQRGGAAQKKSKGGSRGKNKGKSKKAT